MTHQYTEQEKREMNRADKLEERKLRLLWRHCWTCKTKYYLIMACYPGSLLLAILAFPK